MKLLRWILWIVGGLIVLLIVAGVAVALLFDPNQYKPQLVALVKQTTGRTLEMRGPIRLKLFPKIGAAVSGVSLSEPNSPRVFARIDDAQVALAVLPLLRRQLVVDQVEVRGVQAEYVKRRDGTTNIDDLIHPRKDQPEKAPRGAARPSSSPGAVQVDVTGIRVHDAQVIYKDEAAGKSLKLAVDSLTSGRIAEDVPGKLQFALRLQGAQPPLDLALSGSVPYRLRFSSGHMELNGLQVHAEGDAFGQHGLRADLGGDVTLDTAKEVSSIEHLNLTAALLPLAAASAPIKLELTGSGRFDGAQGTAAAALAAVVDDSHAKLDLQILNVARQQFRFNLIVDKVDVDRYLPKRAHEAGAAPAAGTRPAPGATPAAGATSTPGAKPAAGAAAAGASAAGATAAADTPVDFSALKAINGAGTLAIATLIADGLKCEDLRASLTAANGRVDIAPLSATLYQGKLNAAIHVDADARSVGVQEQLAGTALGPLLKDLSGKDLLQGRADVDVDVKTAGGSVNALKRGLAGKASLAVRDGALQGINLGAVARNASALLGGKGPQDVAANSSDKTDFSDLTATFVIRNGVAHNDDLIAHSPFLRLTGAGDIDIGASRLNYEARATVIASAAGQGAAAAGQTALPAGQAKGGAGITVPVRITGSFTQPRYQVDVQSALLDAAKQQAGQRLQDSLKNKVPPELQGPVGDALKGLFGR